MLWRGREANDDDPMSDDQAELRDVSALHDLAHSTPGYPTLRRQASERSGRAPAPAAAMLCASS